jgi:protoporphyrinogen IX oxidase
MTGWLGDAYPWVRAAHVVFVIFWMAGMFMLPRFLVYHMAAAPGSPEDALWIERERRLLRIIIDPAMVAVWLLGLSLAFNLGFEGQGWLFAKIAIVFAFSGYHGWLAGLTRKFARGERPISERRLRLANEVPSLVTILVVILVIVKPF